MWFDRLLIVKTQARDARDSDSKPITLHVPIVYCLSAPRQDQINSFCLMKNEHPDTANSPKVTNPSLSPPVNSINYVVCFSGLIFFPP